MEEHEGTILKLRNLTPEVVEQGRMMREHGLGRHQIPERSCPVCNPHPRDGDGQEPEPFTPMGDSPAMVDGERVAEVMARAREARQRLREDWDNNWLRPNG